jgi:hypothetical protein
MTVCTINFISQLMDNSRGKVGLLSQRIVQMGEDCSHKIKYIANKIYTFYQKYKKNVILYFVMGLVMTYFPNKVVRTLLPGFAWGITFTEGNPLAGDFLVSLTPPQGVIDTWVPFEEEGLSQGLIERQEVACKALRVLKAPGPLGWVLLEGDSRVGKSRMLKALSEKLSQEGYPVYRLETTFLQSGSSLFGMLDARFLAIITELKEVSLRTGKSPILVIDEVQSLLNVSHPGFNDCLKSGPEGLLGFNILAATNQPETVKERDEALYRRFHSFYTLKGLDQDGVIATVIKAKSGLFESKTGVSVSDELIRFTVGEFFKGSDGGQSNAMDCVVNVIQTACYCTESNVLTRNDIEAEIALLS